MKKQDIDFLKDLQHEMLTQDTVCQANPRFWVVRHKKRRYGIEDGFEDGKEVIWDTEKVAKNLKELYECLKEYVEDLDIDYCEGHVIINADESKHFYNIEDLVDYMKEEFSYDGLDIANYIEEYVIVPNTMFLTKRECEEHIKKNHYHYNEPHSYAMTAWRSPQVEKLFDVITNTDWNLSKDLGGE